MTDIHPREHWLDRLAAPHTRRQSLKAAVAGVALTLTGVRSAPARAAGAGDPHACRKGCLYTAHKQFAQRDEACWRASRHAVDRSVVTGLFISPLFQAAEVGTSLIEVVHCHNQALLRQKAMAFDCLQPNCPGFDPAGPQGPCEPCLAVAGAVCCPQQSSSIGYVCCSCCAQNGEGCGSCY